MQGVLQPWPMDAEVAYGTEPRTPKNRTRMRVEAYYGESGAARRRSASRSRSRQLPHQRKGVRRVVGEGLLERFARQSPGAAVGDRDDRRRPWLAEQHAHLAEPARPGPRLAHGIGSAPRRTSTSPASITYAVSPGSFSRITTSPARSVT